MTRRYFDRLHVSVVVLHIILQRSVSKPRVEVVVLHLLVRLIEGPSAVVHSTHRAQHSRAVTATRAVYEECASRGIIREFQNLLELRITRTIRIAHRNVDVM